MADTYRKLKPPVAADQTVYAERTPLRVPLDLREWIAPEKLVTWVKDAIDHLNPGELEVQEFLRMTPEARPRVIFSLLLYGYATQVFASTEIVRSCATDPVLTQLADGAAPTTAQLEHFRRKHRVLLEGALAGILLRAVREKFAYLPKLPPGLEYSMLAKAVDRLDTARHMDNTDV